MVCLIAGRLWEVVAHGSSTVLYLHCKFFRESCSSDNVKLIVGWFFFFLSFILFSHLMKTCGAPSKGNSISVLNLREIPNDCCLLRMGPFLIRSSRKIYIPTFVFSLRCSLHYVTVVLRGSLNFLL